MKARFSLAVALAAVVLHSMNASALPPDAWVTTRAKIALLTSEGFGGLDVNVDTFDGRVTLHGKVASEAEKAKAEQIAKTVPGVREVHDLLQVVPELRRPAVAAADETVRGQVEAALRADPSVGPSRITVGSVNNGVVLLTGETEHSTQHLRAIELARRTPGARRVASTVRITQADPELDVWTHRELRRGGRGVLDAATDLWITAEAKLRLLANDDVSGSDISVDTLDSVVTLFGTAPSEKAKKEAEEEAEGVPRVKSVRNELQVVPAAEQQEVKARDEELQRRVTEAIYARPEMRGAQISVKVKKGVARLTGTVPSPQYRLSAATVARRVPGIRAVKEDLHVTAITEASPHPG